MAVAEINAAGGINGHPVKYTRQPMSNTDPQADLTGIRTALATKPTILIGPDVSTIQLTIASTVNTAGVPMLAITQGAQDKLAAAAGGVKAIFNLRPSEEQQVKAATDFVIDHFHAKRITVLSVDADYGATARTTAIAEIKAKGAAVAGDVKSAFDATDMTSSVLATKNADAVLSFQYPAPSAVLLKQMAQQNVKIPVDMVDTPPYLLPSNLIPANILPYIYGTTDCNAANGPTASDKAWAQRFKAKYGYEADFSAAHAYDSVMLAKGAIAKAGSTDHAAVIKALESISQPGICSSNYHADSQHTLSNSTVNLSFPNGVYTTVS